MIEIIINPKPIYVPLYYQPVYKVLQILMILNIKKYRDKGVSISNIHKISWGMRNEQNLKAIINTNTKEIEGCYEPIMGKVITITLINGYAERLKNGNIKLTEKGKQILSIVDENELFQSQRQMLSQIPSIHI